MARDYNRYELYRNEDDSTIDQVPFVKISQSPSDKFETWGQSSRLDKIAQRYYNNPFFDFIILYGNPQYVNEFDIEIGDVIRIPFPLERARTEYENTLRRIRNN